MDLVAWKDHSDAIRAESGMIRWNQHSKARRKSILVRGCKGPGARMSDKVRIFEGKNMLWSIVGKGKPSPR